MPETAACAGYGNVDNEEHMQVITDFIKQQKEEHRIRFMNREQMVRQMAGFSAHLAVSGRGLVC